MIKSGKLFFLFCEDVEDRDNLMALGSASYKGALMIFKAWVSGISYDGFDFNEACMWVWVEGMALTASRCLVVKRALEKVGKLF